MEMTEHVFPNRGAWPSALGWEENKAQGGEQSSGWEAVAVPGL